MNLVIKRKKLQKIYISLILFMLVFAPPIMPQTHLCLAIFCICMVLLKHKNKYAYILKQGCQWQFGLTIVFLLFYGLLMICVNSTFFSDQVQASHYIGLFNRFLVLAGVVIPSSVYLTCYMEKNGLSLEDYLLGLIHAGILQTILVFSSLLFDNVHTLFLSMLRRFAASSAYDNTWYITVRSYGFARTLVDTFGLGMGIIAGVALLYGYHYKSKYMIYSIFIAVAGMLNARTSMVIYLLSLLLLLPSSMKAQPRKTLLFIAISIVVLLLLFRFLLPYLQENYSATYRWLDNGFQSIYSLIVSNEKEGTIETLFSDSFWQKPDAFQFIFGSGHSLYAAEGYRHSDVGYINDLWFVGILGVTFMYTSLITVIMRRFRSTRVFLWKMIMLYFVIVFFVFNIKGSAIGYNPGMATILTTAFVANYYLRRTEWKRSSVY